MSPSVRPTPLTDVEARLDYRFQEPGFLEQALTHASARSPERPANERLEFLGDAVLDLLVGEHLYRTRPDLEEGPLTRLRSAVVAAPALANAARRLELDQALRLGKGLKRQALSEAILADTFEAVLGAVYLDAGLEPLRRRVLAWLAPELEAGGARAINWKSRLQELIQQCDQALPSYRVLEESGPDHDKRFVIVALLGERELGRGTGSSKKEAEQEAAAAGYEALTRDQACDTG